jgi:FkbM family methyltransferase
MGPSTIRNLRRAAGIAIGEYRESKRTERAWYPNRRLWWVRVYDRVLRKLDWVPLPMRKKIVRTRLAALDKPFFVRLGSSDLQLKQTITYRGEYRPLFDRDIGQVRQIVDLGANAGMTIRLWRDKYPDARIIAVEPDAFNLKMCRLNADAAGGERVQLVQACIDGKPGKVLLDVSGQEQQFHITSQPTGKTVEVDALTVPQVLERTNADEVIDLLKCDIQGPERAVFADCASWIHRVRNMVVELHDDYTDELFLADLERAGWRWSHIVRHKTDVLWVIFLWGEPAQAANAGACAATAGAAGAATVAAG